MKLSVTALDVQFADADGIDRFDRFVFQGRLGDTVSTARKIELKDGVSDVLASLAAQAGVKPADLPAILIARNVPETAVKKLHKSWPHIVLVPDLPGAMEKVRQNGITALLAVSPGKTQKQENATISFADGFEAYADAAGVAGIVLADETVCNQHSLTPYATITGFGCDNDVAIACHQAIDESMVPVNLIRYVEVSALADSEKSDAESQGLIRAYRSEKHCHTAIGSLRSVTGEGGAFSELAGLVKTVLALHQRYYPGTNDWQKPLADGWEKSPFYIPADSRPWFADPAGKPKMAAYSCMSESSYCHFVLEENQALEKHTNGYLASSDLVMIPVAADNQKALLKALDKLEKTAGSVKSLKSIAADAYRLFTNKSQAYTLCLLAESHEELQREISLARDGIEKAFADNSEWKTPKGSYFTTEPVGGENDVTFLYPGIGATYVGLGREIFHLFPEIYKPVSDLADDIGQSLKDEILNPRTIEKPGFKQIKALDHKLRNSLPDIAECGVGFACVFTKIFEEVFHLNADFATGYSMGEVSMYAALGCWKEPGLMSERLANSDTFNHRLTGELQTLRQHWDLPPAKEGEIEQLWETYTLKATPEEIAEAAMDEDRVYTTIINTPDSLVIGGYPEACQRVIKKLGVRAMPLDMPNAIHSEPAFKEYEHMEALYTLDVAERIPTKLYSSSCYLPVPQRTKAIANSIAKCLCDPVDFPRLVNTMYDKGARVFIEMGPGRSLCSWVEKTLKHDEIKPHVSVPVNAKGTSDELTILRAAAKLVSHGVPLELTKLYYGSLLHELPAESRLPQSHQN